MINCAKVKEQGVVKFATYVEVKPNNNIRTDDERKWKHNVIIVLHYM